MPSIDDIFASAKLEFGSIVRADKLPPIKRLSSGSPALDIKIGGGYPCGRMTTIVGDPSMGKTTLCISAAIEAAKTGKIVWIDTEHKWDARYAEMQGLDLSKVHIMSSTIEESIDKIKEAAKTGELALVVWDSLAQGISKRAMAKEATESAFAAAESAAYAHHWPKMLDVLEKHEVPLICTNQWRIKGIGNNSGHTWRDQYGGYTVRYTPTLIIALDKVKVNERGDIPVGQSVTFIVKKNQAGQAYTTGVFEIDFDEEAEMYGISKTGDLLNIALDLGYVVKSGSWYKLEIDGVGDIRSQGKSQFKYDLLQNPEILSALEKKVYESS